MVQQILCEGLTAHPAATRAKTQPRANGTLVGKGKDSSIELKAGKKERKRAKILVYGIVSPLV